MSRSERDKGAGAEREVVTILKASGWPNARRNFGSGSQGGGDLTHGPARVHIEVKRTERLRLREAFDQASEAAKPLFDTPVVVHRCNRGPWLATIEMHELLDLLRIRDEHAVNHAEGVTAEGENW